MKTAGRRNPNRWATVPCTPSQWRGRSEPISLDHLGWEARKTPAVAGVFFLDFPLYRTYRDLGRTIQQKLLNRLRRASTASPLNRSAIALRTLYQGRLASEAFLPLGLPGSYSELCHDTLILTAGCLPLPARIAHQISDWDPHRTCCVLAHLPLIFAGGQLFNHFL
jgi:hypothetical protein